MNTLNMRWAAVVAAVVVGGVAGCARQPTVVERASAPPPVETAVAPEPMPAPAPVVAETAPPVSYSEPAAPMTTTTIARTEVIDELPPRADRN